VGEITVYATTWCPDCWRAKRVLNAEKAPYRWINIDHDEDAAQRVVELNDGFRSVPTILFPDGSVLVEPSSAALKAKLAEVGAS
jgi:mycoredoxin